MKKRVWGMKKRGWKKELSKVTIQARLAKSRRPSTREAESTKSPEHRTLVSTDSSREKEEGQNIF